MTRKAKRFNSGKVDLTYLPKAAALEECKVWMKGAEKYDRDNWKKLWGEDTVNVAMASLMRHVVAINDGYLFDEETGLPHAAHIRCNAAMVLEYMANKGMIDPNVMSEEQQELKPYYIGGCL